MPPPPSSTRPSHPPFAPAHRALLRAVTELGGTTGRRTLTAAGIAWEAGVPAETFFEYFADTDACLLAAHDDWVERAFRPYDGARAQPSADDAAAARRAFLAGLIGDLYGDLARLPTVARVCLVEAPAAGRRGLVARDRAIDRLRRTLVARALPPDRPDLAFAALVAAGGIYEVAQQRTAAGNETALPALVPVLTALWARVLAGSG